MLPEGEDKICLTRDLFPKRHDVGFSRPDISVHFHFKDNLLESVTVSSKVSVVKTKTLRQVESEDETEVINFLKIRCRKDLRGLIMFLTPLEKKKVKRLRKSDISVKTTIWQWDFAEYSKRLVRTSITEFGSYNARCLLAFLRGRKHE